MAYYEYFTYNISAWLSSHYMHMCPAVNGAAFAIKREVFEKVGGFHRVVGEDIDIATRAFLEDNTFAYCGDVEVKNVVYSDWSKWFTQRRRWAIGQALWLKDWYQDLAKRLLKKPQVFLPSLFFLYPSVAVFLLSLLVPNPWVYNSFSFARCFSRLNSTFCCRCFWFLLKPELNLLKILFISLSSFALTATRILMVFQGNWL